MLRIDSKLARMLGAFGLAAAVALVAGCGGGGSSSSSASSTGSAGGTGGTGGTSGTGGTTLAAGVPVSSLPASLASNQTAVVVGQGVKGAPNIPAVSVTVCIHGTSTCQTINNIQLDTGSWGLRLTQDALNSTMTNGLPVETVGGKTVADCAGFADGNSWGTVRTADVTIGGETASSVPIQVLGDLPQSAAGGSSNNCAVGTLNDTSSAISAHGILGIGTAKYDCGSGCTAAGIPNGVYYGCTGSGFSTSCTDLAVPEPQQVTNPIRLFPADNNGVILNMPAVTSAGATSATGFLTFGIGTESNNVLPSSGIQQITTDHYGNVASASLSGTFVSGAFFDTGSNGLFFLDSALTLCSRASGFYCPSSTVALTSSVTGFNGTNASIAFSVANAETMFADGGMAYGNVGGTSSGTSFDFGLPFFYGRTVYLNYDPNADGNSGIASTAYVAF